MGTQKADNTCRRIRSRLYSALNEHFDPQTPWLQGHLANCPRCQRRLVLSGKVHLALSFVKAQPHGFDLLARANEQAISVLKHRLRQEPKATELKAGLPKPKPLETYGKYGFSIASLAACVAILILMKIGVFSSMDAVQNEGQKVIRQYYVKQVGRDLAEEVFPDQMDPPPARPKHSSTV